MHFIELETKDLTGDEYVIHVLREEIAVVEEPTADRPIAIVLKNGKEYLLNNKVKMTDIRVMLNRGSSSLNI